MRYIINSLTPRAWVPLLDSSIQFNQSNGQTWWVYQDKDAPMMRLKSPVPAPWDGKWEVVVNTRKGKSDKSKYLQRVELKIYPIANTERLTATLRRDRIKGRCLQLFPEGNNSQTLIFPPETGLVYTIWSLNNI